MNDSPLLHGNLGCAGNGVGEMDEAGNNSEEDSGNETNSSGTDTEENSVRVAGMNCEESPSGAKNYSLGNIICASVGEHNSTMEGTGMANGCKVRNKGKQTRIVNVCQELVENSADDGSDEEQFGLVSGKSLDSSFGDTPHLDFSTNDRLEDVEGVDEDSQYDNDGDYTPFIKEVSMELENPLYLHLNVTQRQPNPLGINLVNNKSLEDIILQDNTLDHKYLSDGLDQERFQDPRQYVSYGDIMENRSHTRHPKVCINKNLEGYISPQTDGRRQQYKDRIQAPNCVLNTEMKVLPSSSQERDEPTKVSSEAVEFHRDNPLNEETPLSLRPFTRSFARKMNLLAAANLKLDLSPQHNFP
ncbi:uncharacterized protein LOC127248900 [Andrographis paniculata]|uniref:uncharacterized protein LOC127248900 n=1 Tax=Andrographis paniculata TaxID=175694 RepID=UPI0021E90199|nr:uncharacterized protein LOC127248900 [Andrographis paniculata]XP_051127425.1 uncharacterized protein LOC127248900 [Andrographis paniculata]XP_051127433.1 uncharacterized protein LOC127248900 [Andrographis paniculata]XP_051127442.1 uncharacterized protein LOC127248900 [Andrographis paniculata]XP_051127450.1 uncharacterized protein LOC127248900 [Andrographis paniculata]XP_051127458.1 uncharacterized protein LOC127248900 [Andrographis paniculata]XP_051127468.1 uncharacterized protein LOC12724